MEDYKIITKRSYAHSQNSKMLVVKEYLIVEKDQKRYLLLKLFNRTRQTLREFNYVVVQKSLNGTYLATTEYASNNAHFKGLSYFIPDIYLEISNECEDVFLELKTAVFDNFLYDNGKKYTISSMNGRNVENNDNVVTKKPVAKLPKTIAIVFLLATVVVLIASILGVHFYKTTRNSFNLDDFSFIFANGISADDSPIQITRYNGYANNIVIPDYINDHEVVSIGRDAFANNQYISDVKIEGNIVIEDNAFTNCYNLRNVNFDNVLSIGTNAFSYSGIENITSTNITNISSYAFYNCFNLNEVNLDNKESEISVGNYAFANCGRLADLTLKNNIYCGVGAFSNCSWLENIDVADYSYINKYNESLIDALGIDPQSNKLKTIKIGHMQNIPTEFLCGYSNLETVNITNLDDMAIPDYAFKDCPGLENVALPTGIQSIGLEAFKNCGLTSFKGQFVKTIDDYAFLNCSNLREISLNDNLESLGAAAFNGCSSLKSIYIPKKLDSIKEYTFANCSSLDTIRTSKDSNLEKIGDNAFSDCTSLKNIIIPNTVGQIGMSAFNNCSSLVEFDLPERVTIIKPYTFSGCSSLASINKILHSRIENIEEGAFKDCSGLKSVKVPDNLVELAPNMFSGCSSLSSVLFGNESICENIGTNAFKGCTSLIKMDFPNSLLSIGDEAFMDCDQFQSLEFNRKLDLGQGAFKNCDKLTIFKLNNNEGNYGNGVIAGCNALDELVIPTTNTVGGNNLIDILFYDNEVMVPESLRKIVVSNQEVIPAYAFTNCHNVVEIDVSKAKHFEYSAFSGCSSLKYLTYSNTLESIGDSCFKGCHSLETFAIPELISYLPSYVFYDCSSLKEIDLPSNITSIGSYALALCTSLQEINIPISVSYISNGAFSGCTGLQNFSVPNGTSLSSGVIEDCTSIMSINVPNITSVNELYGGKDIPETLKYVTINDNKEISNQLFLGCNNVEKISLPDANNVQTEAFANLQSLIEVSFSNKLATVGDRAFYNCPALKKVKWPSFLTTIGSECFSNCTGLEEMILPEGLESIQDRLFSGCSHLGSVTIPSSVSYISWSVFSDCRSLYEIINKSYQSIDSDASIYPLQIISDETQKLTSQMIDGNKYVLFNNEWYLTSYDMVDNKITLPGEVIYNDVPIDYNIKNGLFKSVYIGDTLVIPECVKSIGNYAFSNTGLNDIEIAPNGRLANIGERAFQNCYFEKLIFNDGLVNIGPYAFYDCYNIKTVTLPRTLMSVESGAFEYCSNLYEIYNLSTLNITLNDREAYGGIASYALVVNNSLSDKPLEYFTQDCFDFICNDRICILKGFNSSMLEGEILRLPEVVIYNDYEHNSYSISNSVFTGQYNIKEIYIPNGVTSIDNEAFRGMGQLEKVHINDDASLKYIGSYAFSYCSNLKEINIPNTLEYIYDNAFIYDYKLRQIKIPSTIISIGEDAFYECNDLYEVFNMSNFNIQQGQDTYGYVAKNAMFINNDYTKPQIEYYDDDTFSFWAVQGKCSLRKLYVDSFESLSLPTSVNMGSNIYNSYTIEDGVLGMLYTDKLEIPKAISDITSSTFNGASIREIVFAKDSPITKIPVEAFYGHGELINIVLPQGITTIGDRAFYNCFRITTHFELNKLRVIGSEAFYNCDGLRSFTLPKTIIKAQIANNAFNGCDNIVYIENNSNFTLVAGSTDMGKIALHAVLVDSNYDGIPFIEDFQFEDNGVYTFLGINGKAYLKAFKPNNEIKDTMFLPSEVKSPQMTYTSYTIKISSLEELNNITTIYIPKSVTKIESNVFATKNKLETVYYEGTKAEWKEIGSSDTVINESTIRFESKFVNGEWDYQGKKPPKPLVPDKPTDDKENKDNKQSNI